MSQPELRSVLDVITQDMIVEEIVLAEDAATHNRPLYDWVQSRWQGVPVTGIPHAEMLTAGAARAKAIVRTGALNPWGNVLLLSGVDVPAYFSRPGVVVPDYYRDRMPADDPEPEPA